MNVTGAEIRKIREALGEDQTTFGARFGVHRRTVIRWEKSADHWFRSWIRWGSHTLTGDAEAVTWEKAVKLAAAKLAPRKNPKRKRTTALGARKPKAARRRQSARKAVAVKRRRGSVARRRSVSRGKARRAKR